MDVSVKDKENICCRLYLANYGLDPNYRRRTVTLPTIENDRPVSCTRRE